MTINNDALIRKIRRLCDLRDHNPSEAESAAAAEMIQGLLAANGIEMATIEAAREKSGQGLTGEAEGSRGQQMHFKSAMYNYQRELMACVAKNNFCMHWIEKKWKKDPNGKKTRWIHDKPSCDGENNFDSGRIADTHILIGRDVNIVGTQLMYDYLIETMDSHLPYQGMDKRGKDALLWLAGCTERLTERLTEKRWRQQKESEEKQAQGGETGIVLASVYSSEEDNNYDVKIGQPVGTTAREKRERRAKYLAAEQKEKELIESGVSADDAYYLARGWEVPVKIVKVDDDDDTPEVPEKEETEAQKRKRLEREERRQERRQAKWRREQDKEDKKRNHPAYRGGMKKAEDIGLHDQVKSADRKGIA